MESIAGTTQSKPGIFSFPAGITAWYEPYTLQNTLEYQGKYYVCGTGRQPILRNKMENDNYYLLTLAAIAKEIQQRGEKRECAVNLGAGLPLAGFGREKKAFREYLLRSSQPVNFKFEGISYQAAIQDVRLFPQGCSAIAVHPELIRGEPSVLLMDVGGWTVALMRLDNGIPNASACRSLELGMIRCIDEAKEQVRRETGLSVTDAQVERVLAGQKVICKDGRECPECHSKTGADLHRSPAVRDHGSRLRFKSSPGSDAGRWSLRDQRGNPAPGRPALVFTLLHDKVFERILGQLSGGVSKK